MEDYSCDCSGLGYYGKNCDRPYFSQRIKNVLSLSAESKHYLVTHFGWFWGTVNRFKPLHDIIMRQIYLVRSGMVDSPPRYNSAHEYITADVHFNQSYYARSLPPVPRDCPTPSGTFGNPKQPDLDVLIDRFFLRRRFIAEPHGTNVLFAFYAQHFTHQFLKTDEDRGPGFTWGSDGVDGSHIYGKDLATRNSLRSFVDGKLKMQVINGEEYPLRLSDMANSPDMIYPRRLPNEHKFALGHPFFGLLPGLFALATIWMREHNRVCGVLRVEHPEWDDERLYQTSRLIIIGEVLKITVEDYVQHLSQYKLRLSFEPELVHDTAFQFSNRIRVEFNQLYHWHPLFPDTVNVSGRSYTVEELVYNNQIVVDRGLTDFVADLTMQRAGAMMHHNHASILIPILKQMLQYSRDLRMQPYNQYRKRFGLKPFKSFHDFIDDYKMADELQELYGSIDALEFYVGMFLETPRESITPNGMVDIGGPYSVKGLIANPLCSPLYWKPSTFGGDVGFNIIKTASLENLFCSNLKGECPRISFVVPEGPLGDGVVPEAWNQEAEIGKRNDSMILSYDVDVDVVAPTTTEVGKNEL